MIAVQTVLRELDRERSRSAERQAELETRLARLGKAGLSHITEFCTSSLKLIFLVRQAQKEAAEYRAQIAAMKLYFDWTVPAVLTLPNGKVETYWPK